MSRQRTDNYIIEVDGPQVNIATEKTSSVLVQEVLSCDFKAIKKSLLENAQMGGSSAGSLAPIAGVYFDNAKASVEMYPEGTRTVADYSASNANTAFGLMLGTVAQQAPSAFVRSKVSSGDTTTLVEDLAQAHKPATVGSKTPVALLAVQKVSSGVINIVPAQYSSSNTLNLMEALSFSPSANDIIYAGLNWQFNEAPSSGYYLTLRQLGNDQKQNRKAIGCVGQMSVPAVAPNELPKCTFNFSVASGSVNFADTRPAASTSAKPSTYAGSELKIGVAASAMSNVCGRIEFTLGTDFVAEKCPDPENKIGIQNWLRNAGSAEVKLTMPHDFVPSSLTDGPAYDSWTEFLESGGNESFHILANYNQKKMGSTFAVYFPELVVVSADDGEEDSYGVVTITLKPKRDSVYVPWIAGIF